MVGDGEKKNHPQLKRSKASVRLDGAYPAPFCFLRKLSPRLFSEVSGKFPEAIYGGAPN